MSDLIGQWLGQYELIGLLGKGGTATVYRARQSNVERDVAIKVLKPEHIDNPDFSNMFDREAKLVASLSHPHILKLFDYGQQGDTVYLVTELLTGGSLADLIKAGPLPLSVTRRIFRQMAEAMDYAHRRGIIHRDLKSGNVLLDEEGNVFLMDFGIATLLSEVAAQAELGLIVGTPTYTAPEQWLGLEVDARTDLYALGVILFEMLTGKAPFIGNSLDDLIQQHLNAPPPSLCDLDPDLPPKLDEVIQKVLAKTQADRYETAAAFAEAFEEAARSQDAPEAVFSAVAVELERPAPQKRRSPLVVGVVVVVLMLLGAALGILSRGGEPGMILIAQTGSATSTVRPGSATPSSVPTRTPIPLTATSTPNLQATIAAGIARTATARASAVKASAQTPTGLPPTAVAALGPPIPPATLAFASDRDGNWEIYLTDTSGQNVRNLTQHPADDTRPVWSPDGTQIAFSSDRDKNQEIYVMDLHGQNVRNLTNNSADDTLPVWSPDGKQIAFVSVRDGHAEIYVTDTKGAAQRITENKTPDLNPVWSPDGRQIAFEAKGSGNTGIRVVDLSTRKERGLTTHRSNNRFPVWSPDAKRVAFISDRKTRWDVFVIDADGKNERNLTDNPANDINPLWSPDGRRIVFISDRRDAWEIWLMDADGGNPDRLTSARRTNTSPAWSPDGKYVAFYSTLDGNRHIFVMDADGNNQRNLTNASHSDVDPAWQPLSTAPLIGVVATTAPVQAAQP